MLGRGIFYFYLKVGNYIVLEIIQKGNVVVPIVIVLFPAKIELNSKKRIIYCYADYNHNLIIFEDGSMYIWGNTANGKLGYFEDKFTQDTPKEILGMKIKVINLNVLK